MRNQIAHGYFACNIRVIHLKFGQIFYHFVIPIEFLFINEDRQTRRRKSLRVRRNRKQSIFVHLFRLIQLPNAIAFGKHDFIVFDNRNRNARHVPFRARLFGVSVNFLELFVKRLRENEDRKNEQQ